MFQLSSRSRRQASITVFLTSAVLLTVTTAALGQTYPRTRLETVTPPGAKAGTTVEVTIGGADLDDVKQLYFSDSRIKAQFVPPPKPPIDPKTKKPKKVNPGPPKFKVTVPADVPVGIYDVRAIGKWGISNPRAFVVGDLKEVMEKEANNDVTQMQPVELNVTVNGVIGANTDVDYYTFKAKKGQRIVAYCAAADIDSRLEPFIQLFWKKKKTAAVELDASRRYFDRNALVSAIAPADGEYYIRVCQFAYIFGGSQAFYRLSIGTTPWIDGAFPPSVQTGKTANIEIIGKNLPGGKLDTTLRLDGQPLERAMTTVKAPAPGVEGILQFPGLTLPMMSTVDAFAFRVKNASGHSNPVLLSTTDDPVIIEKEANDEPGQAQSITLPCTICGRIEKLGDRDWYTFTGKKGESFVFEGFAARIGTPTDLFIHIWQVSKTMDPKTKKEKETATLRANYETHAEIPTKVGRFSLNNLDPQGRFTIPADGTYRVMVTTRTAYTQYGPRYVYRVNVRKEKPDFRLIVVQNDTANAGGFLIHKGGRQAMSVVAIRRDGFDGPIHLKVEGLPNGVKCPEQVLGNKLKQCYLVFEAAPNAPDWAGAVTIKGTAIVNGKTITRTALPGCIVWSAPNNVPAISRLARSVCLAVGEKGPYTLETNVSTLALPPGGKGEIKVKVNRQLKGFTEQVQVVRLCSPALSNGNFSNFPNVNVPKGKTEATIKFTLPTNTVPGEYNLVFEGRAKYNFVPDPKNPKKKRNSDVYEVSPPIKVIIYNQVAEIAFANPNLKVQAGKEAELIVNIKRLHNYDGEFTVQFLPASGFGGISAANVKVPKGANQAKIKLKIAKNAKVGSSPNFKVKVTARVGNVTMTHEANFTMTITKAAALLRQPGRSYLAAAHRRVAGRLE